MPLSAVTLGGAETTSSGSRMAVTGRRSRLARGYLIPLAASVTTGYTVQAAVEAVRYYSGMPVGVSCIFSCLDECAGFPVVSIFNQKRDLPDYESHSSADCPLCKRGEKLDGLVNSFGISSFR